MVEQAEVRHSWLDQWRERLGPRAGAIALALLVEGLLALLLLTLAPRILTPPDDLVPMAVFDVDAQKKTTAQQPAPAPPPASTTRAAQAAVQPAPSLTRQRARARWSSRHRNRPRRRS